ncbi:MAG: TAT-variant-translocated molybdopterin oxidoreductase [Bacteriovorax sp.]|nr:TAT-variant-translocated molybdopterin oxidoreductase [Bacteriovorax sp.]
MYRKNLSFPTTTTSSSTLFGDGKKFWKSYEQWRESSEVEELIEREFQVDASIFANTVSRRHFFKIMGASMALAGLEGCRRSPVHKIVSFVNAPEGLIPGKSVFYARSLNRGGFAVGVLVESFMGRPIKIEGNPEHSMSLGATDIFLQAEILNLYDPDRLRTPLKEKIPSSWMDFQKEWKARAIQHNRDKGQGLRILCERSTSETYLDQRNKILKRYPKAKIISYDPIARDLLKESTIISYNKYLEPVYDFTKAQIIVSIDRDFLSDEAAGLRYSHDFADNRRLLPSQYKKINRLYCIESDFTITGSMADHRLSRSRSEIEQFISKLALKLGVTSGGINNSLFLSEREEKWISLLVRELHDHLGSSLIIASETLSAESQSLVFLMNEKLRNIGTTVNFYKPTDPNSGQEMKNLKSLAEEMNQGEVSSLIILSQNPIYTAPKDLGFEKSLEKVAFSVCLTHVKNETSEKCTWALPESHSLESWSDARALDGTLSINQPLIAPLFDTCNSIELLSLIVDDSKSDSHELIKNYWLGHISALIFDSWWESALRLGFVENSAYQHENVKSHFVSKKGFKKIPISSKSSLPNLELHFKADPTLRDGHFANNGWLQELPKPITKLCWSNAVLISPALAVLKELKNGDEITIQTNVGKLDAPIWILPGLAENVLVIHFGHGRRVVGRVGHGIGSDAFQLLHSNAIDGVIREIKITRNGHTKELACTQLHHSFESREPLKVREIKDYPSLKKENSPPKSLIIDSPITPSKDYAWGMSIDLNVCTGCNACVIGCQAENNVPIVGEAEVIRGREMHWLRVDRYFEGVPDFAKLYFQPLACVHCEKAPCEVVCPVAATSHSTEGINQMVYNRCVGTRYCSNNCPYKVRRFNFLEYNDKKSEFVKMRSNPDVSVRTRGVMEKCTYCIQRINESRVEAELEGRNIKDGEIKTACQQACATKAIVFGNLLDPQSEVSKLHDSIQSYELLGELGTLPRTRYLTRFRNSNPDFVV